MINEIFAKYGSDKAEHNYGPFYEQWLPKNPRKILEIGVKEGASIRAWKEIFPNAEIHGLDLFEEFPIPEIEGVIFHKGSQIDPEILHLLRKENFDLIIDDGSHNTRDQLMTFFGLINSHCIYIIEDLHCESDYLYNQGLPQQLWPSRSLPIIYHAFDSINPKIVALSCSSISDHSC